jgi:nitroreductase
VEKSKSAPVTAIFAYDLEYYNKMDKLAPHNPNMKGNISSSKEMIFDTAFRNSTLQAAYFMIIARAKGIDSGAMSGFNEKALNEAFFANSSYRVNFVLNLGYRNGENPFPKLPRLDFNEACQVV